MVAAREKQQRQLQEIANRSTIRERSSVAASSSSSSCNEDDNKTWRPSIQQRIQTLKERQEELQKQHQLEERKKKKRTLYLKQLALKKEEEEIQRKDAELGPGWRYREDPTSATAAVLNRMDPQSNSSSYNGGYKPQARKRQGGGWGR